MGVSVTDRLMGEKDLTAIAASDRQALSAAPISSSALHNLIVAETDLGHANEANSLLSFAAPLGWRDGPTQFSLAQVFLRQQDYLNAAQRLDAAGRISFQPDALYASLDDLIADRAFSAALSERLALNPPWRASYFNDVAGLTAAMLRSKARLIGLLVRSKSPPSVAEASPVLNALVATDQADVARALWLAILDTRAGAVYDPNFRSSNTVGSSPFAWALPSVLGIELTLGSDQSEELS